MKQTKQLKLTHWQSFNHYFIIIFILLIPGFTLFNLLEIYITKTYDGIITTKELISNSSPWIILAIVFYFIQKRRLRFRELEIKCTEQELQEAVAKTAKEHNWQIKNNSENFIRAIRPWNWSGSFGEMITIIKDQDRIFFNSICNPDIWSSILSYGSNKRNIDNLIKNILDLKKRVPLQETNGI